MESEHKIEIGRSYRVLITPAIFEHLDLGDIVTVREIDEEDGWALVTIGIHSFWTHPSDLEIITE